MLLHSDCKLMQSKCTKTEIGHFGMLTALCSGCSRLLPEAGDFISLFQRNTSLEVFAETHAFCELLFIFHDLFPSSLLA